MLKGYDNPESGVQYGQWYNGSEKDIERTGSSIPKEGIRYLHLVLANTETGGCEIETFELNLDKSKFTSWDASTMVKMQDPSFVFFAFLVSLWNSISNGNDSNGRRQ